VNHYTWAQATWFASDPESPITGYRYAIGSTFGGTDVINWTPVENLSQAAVGNNSVVRDGLGLIEGRQYWFSVQARNIAGLWSLPAAKAIIAGRSSVLVCTFLPLVI
jgi:hypothetical protein